MKKKSLKKQNKGCIGCFGFTALAAILLALLALVPISQLEEISTKSKISFIKNTITNIVNECSTRLRDGLSTKFSDINYLIDSSVGAIMSPRFRYEELDSDTCFNIIAYPPDKELNEITWFSIKLDQKTGFIERNCGDSSKLGCEEENTWQSSIK